MKKLSIISIALASSALVACGGGSGSPSKPNLCTELNVTNCDQVVIPSSASSSSSSIAPPVNDMLPISENFAVENALQLFNQSYKTLLDPNPEDPNNSLYYSTSGLDAGRMVAANGKFTIGNARFTIGQRLQTTGTHINPAALPADFKAETTTQRGAEGTPTTTTWGDLDLTNPWKVSFCVNEWEHTGSTANNQLFMIYVDNNTSGSANSYHLAKSLVAQVNISNFTPGKRVEFNIPGDVLVEGRNVDSTENPGTTSSFIQLRVPSNGVVTMSELWIGYQADTSTEPTNSTCTAGSRVPGWNIALPPEAPVAPTFEPNNNQLKVNWEAAARATSYTVAYNTVDSLEGATLVTGITGTTTTITGLENGTSYYVFIKAINNGGESAYGPSAVGVPDVPKTPPEAPTGLKVFSDDRRALVTWDVSAGAESYSVAVSTSNDPAAATVTDGITDTNYRVKNLVNDTPYYVFVRGVNVIGNGAYSPAQAVTPMAFDVYQANFAVTLEQFFDSTSATTSLAFPATPAAQTISLENDQAMALTLAGESRMVLTEAGLRVGNARFAVGLQGVKQENGTYTYTATAANTAPVGGTLDLTNNYQICYTVVEKHTDGLFRVYVDNTSTTSGNSIHGTKSRLINQDIVAIPLNTEQCVDFIDDAHVGTANSFIQVGTDGNATAVGVVLSSFKIVDLNTTPIKTETSSSSSVASSVASSSSVVASSVASSEASSSSSVEVSSSSSSSSSEASSSSSVASSAPSGGTDVNTAWASFDPNTYISILSNPVASTTNNAVIQSSTAHSVNGLNFFHSATGTLRHRGGSNLEWNFNGTGFASGDPVAAVGAAAEEMRAYIGVPVDAGRAVTITVVHRNSTSAGTALGSIVFVGSDENVLAKYDAKVGTATTTTFSLPAGHTQTEVKFLFSREGGGAGGMHVTSIDKTYN
ncbi:MAG TPA: fibronectin type III domain-containing protein [Cellvibrio sp.]